MRGHPRPISPHAALSVGLLDRDIDRYDTVFKTMSSTFQLLSAPQYHDFALRRVKFHCLRTSKYGWCSVRIVPSDRVFKLMRAISLRETVYPGTEITAHAPKKHKDLLQPIDLPEFQAHDLATTLWSAQSQFRCRPGGLFLPVPLLSATLEAIHQMMAKAHTDLTLCLTQRPRPSLTLCSYMAWVEGRKVPGPSPMISLCTGRRNGFHKILCFEKSGYIALDIIRTGVTRASSTSMISPKRSLDLCMTAL